MLEQDLLVNKHHILVCRGEMGYMPIRVVKWGFSLIFGTFLLQRELWKSLSDFKFEARHCFFSIAHGPLTCNLRDPCQLAGLLGTLDTLYLSDNQDMNPWPHPIGASFLKKLWGVEGAVFLSDGSVWPKSRFLEWNILLLLFLPPNQNSSLLCSRVFRMVCWNYHFILIFKKIRFIKLLFQI